MLIRIRLNPGRGQGPNHGERNTKEPFFRVHMQNLATAVVKCYCSPARRVKRRANCDLAEHRLYQQTEPGREGTSRAGVAIACSRRSQLKVPAQ